MIARRTLVLLLTLFSVALILGAWFFQYGMGLEPCAMCYWQRWPHWAAAAFGVAAYALGARALCWLAGLSVLTTSLIGFYHSGVERKWWPGPESCTGRGLTADMDNLLSMEGGGPALCDEIPWQIMGLTMANLNAVGSLVVAALWIHAARKAA